MVLYKFDSGDSLKQPLHPLLCIALFATHSLQPSQGPLRNNESGAHLQELEVRNGRQFDISWKRHSQEIIGKEKPCLGSDNVVWAVKEYARWRHGNQPSLFYSVNEFRTRFDA